MATRTESSEFASRLAELLGVAQGEGKVLISARGHYFPSEKVEVRSEDLGQRAESAWSVISSRSLFMGMKFIDRTPRPVS